VSKKVPPKSRLVSPKSALRALDDQETLFGSASQLAREESPTLLRDTLEALKQSTDFPSDPISPPKTQPYSIESTSPKPSRGTSRFVKRRNLWSAAGRDENEALLHVDTIDLVDSPAVRLALAGKDALFQPGPCTDHAAESSRISMADMHKTPLINKSSMVDIDDIVTPGVPTVSRSPSKVQMRSYHTSTTMTAAAKTITTDSVPAQRPAKDTTESAAGPVKKAVKANTKPAPAKPSYAGFTDHALQKQISAYGFKAIKKREKMIERLDRCWQEKHGTSSEQVAVPDIQVDTMTHGDFLSKVHDISTRPVAKVTKPRVKRKTADAPTTPKEPKKRKKAEPKAKDTTTTSKATKTPRKQKPKTPALSEAFVADINDIDDANANTANPVAAKATTQQKAPKKSTVKRRSRIKPATPPPTLPLTLSSSPTPKEEVDALIPEQDTTALPLSLTPPLPDLQSQIQAAIMSKPPPSPVITTTPTKTTAKKGGPRDITSSIQPTWREKILMYDPISLEQLAAWLNTTGFRAIGEDREVSPLEVREWCENNGVCCYGIGGGWRGNNKKKGAVGEEDSETSTTYLVVSG
jgi:hypothetical protein